MEKKSWKIVMNLDGEVEDSGGTYGEDCGCRHEHGGREEAREELQLAVASARPFYTGSYLKHRR